MSADVEVRRSARRRRTVAAHREGDRIVVLIPARFSRAEEARWVAQMVRDILAREDRNRLRGARAGDAALMSRALELNRHYFEGRAQPQSVTWVDTMRSRWGSCTPIDRTIRLSDRLRDFPPWVVDYVLVHELAHLVVPGHGPDFWVLVDRYDRTERARGFLEGVAAAGRLVIDDGDIDEDDIADGDIDATDVVEQGVEQTELPGGARSTSIEGT